MEWWDLYDCNRDKVGQLHQRGVPVPDCMYHLVVHVWIQNEQGELLLAKRHPSKHYGNLWECVGGSVIAGETSLDGALREVEEELGVKLNPVKGRLLHSELRKTHHVDNWLFQANVKLQDLSFQEDEVIDAKWVDKEEYDHVTKTGNRSNAPLFFRLSVINKKITCFSV